MTPKTFKIKSFGCQMNVYDGDRMAELLTAQGMTAAADGEDADLVVLNTCHIREKAAEKAYSDVGRLRREDGTKPLIALAGCVAQAEGAEAQRRSPMIDIVVGPQAYHRLPEMVAEGPAAPGRSTPTCRRSASSTPSRSADAPTPARSSRCRKAATNSAPIASCPTRAAPKSRGRGTTSSLKPRRWSTAGRARSSCSART